MVENFSSEICRGFVVVVLVVGFLSGESCWGFLWSSLFGFIVRFSVMKVVDICSVYKVCCCF